MKNYLLLFLIAAMAITSCKKDSSFDPEKQAQEDDVLIRAYIDEHGIEATKDPSGLYYQIISPGADVTPGPASPITVNYTGKLLNGTTFDQGTNVTLSLNRVIEGWRRGIPKIQKGGRIILLIPSAMGYGQYQAGAIPANSVLFFDITLVNVGS